MILPVADTEFGSRDGSENNDSMKKVDLENGTPSPLSFTSDLHPFIGQ